MPGKKRALIFLSGHFYKLEDKLRMEMFKPGRGGDGTRGSATGRNNGAVSPRTKGKQEKSDNDETRAA